MKHGPATQHATRHEWPDLASRLGRLMARIGTPLRLALLWLKPDDARTLRREIAALETDVRERFHDLFLRVVAMPAMAAQLLSRIRARQNATELRRAAATHNQNTRGSSGVDARREHDTTSIPGPSLARLLATPRKPSPTDKPPRPAISRPVSPPRQPLLPLQHGTIPALPLARRIVALEQAISDPYTAALGLLKTRPELVLDAGWTPPTEVQPEPETPPARPMRENRFKRRKDKARDRAAFKALKRRFGSPGSDTS